eukprot:TRINITY_DN76472_c0_g1_i1.p1 TRINITY_DN76472_c0_g1~~TRINITY_DN76472_c0_g1_i1.p1  ORF type:complete len:239 (+),score=69.92 TRINITY_DN76472_c0_g1_i1:103-819(+)
MSSDRGSMLSSRRARATAAAVALLWHSCTLRSSLAFSAQSPLFLASPMDEAGPDDYSVDNLRAAVESARSRVDDAQSYVLKLEKQVEDAQRDVALAATTEEAARVRAENTSSDLNAAETASRRLLAASMELKAAAELAKRETEDRQLAQAALDRALSERDEALAAAAEETARVERRNGYTDGTQAQALADADEIADLKKAIAEGASDSEKAKTLDNLSFEAGQAVGELARLSASESQA